MSRVLNKESINLVKEFEGLVLKAYYDIANVLTIGYGHTNRAGGFKFNSSTKISEAQAEKILREDLGKAKAVVNKYVEVELNDNQFGALVSLVHNIGEGNFSGSSVVRRLNAGDTEGAATAILMWNKARVNGKLKVVSGLVRRRKAEMNLFLKDQFEDVASKKEEKTIVSGDNVCGGEQKKLRNSKTAWFGGLTILGAASQISEVAALIPQLAPYAPYALLAIGAAIIINRWMEARKGEH